MKRLLRRQLVRGVSLERKLEELALKGAQKEMEEGKGERSKKREEKRRRRRAIRRRTLKRKKERFPETHAGDAGNRPGQAEVAATHSARSMLGHNPGHPGHNGKKRHRRRKG